MPPARTLLHSVSGSCSACGWTRALHGVSGSRVGGRSLFTTAPPGVAEHAHRASATASRPAGPLAVPSAAHARRERDLQRRRHGGREWPQARGRAGRWKAHKSDRAGRRQQQRQSRRRGGEVQQLRRGAPGLPPSPPQARRLHNTQRVGCEWHALSCGLLSQLLGTQRCTQQRWACAHRRALPSRAP